MLIKDQAICIRTVDYSDTSQILTFFGIESGKFSAIAKGSRRLKSAFGGAIEMFSHGQLVYSTRGDDKLATLTEFSRQGDFGMLRRSLHALNAAMFAAELVNLLTTDHDPHPGIHESLVELLSSLEQAATESEAVGLLIVFQLGLLGDLGQGLVIDRCGNCKNPARNWQRAYFSSTLHGLLCRDCESSFHDRIEISPAAAGCLADLSKLHGAQSQVLWDIEKAIIYHLTAILHRPPRMAAFFAKA